MWFRPYPKIRSDLREQGTQNINTISNTAGAAYGGAFGVGGATTKTSGISQSKLGQKAAPPERKSYKWVGIIGFIAFLCMGVWYVAFPVIAICALFAYKAYEFNSKEWPDLYQYWLDCWMCNKCGNVYHQD